MVVKQFSDERHTKETVGASEYKAESEDGVNPAETLINRKMKRRSPQRLQSL